ELVILGLVREEPHLAFDVADDQVDPAVAIPVRQGDRARPAGENRKPARESQPSALRVLALAEAAEEVDLARGIRPRHDVRDPVAVEVRELRTESDASPRRDARFLLARLEPSEAVELRLLRGPDVLVDAQLALAELTDEEVGDPVAVEVR